ncbi:hypothetical protein P8452_56991 [Trifolium repens]|nr:hypothetical protein P8452_56991 [Trifolium repens]
MPRFTSGWKELWEFYKLSEEHHPVMLVYTGGSEFDIFPTVYPKMVMSEIPNWHTLYGIHDDSIQFDRVIPSLDSKVVKWEMSRSFIHSIRKYGHGFIRAVGPSGKMFTCNVSEVEGEDDCIHVDYGWMEMFMENGFNSGDILRIIPEGFASSNVVKFEKKLREECILGDELDFEINPTLHWMNEYGGIAKPQMYFHTTIYPDQEPIKIHGDWLRHWSSMLDFRKDGTIFYSGCNKTAYIKFININEEWYMTSGINVGRKFRFTEPYQVILYFEGEVNRFSMYPAYGRNLPAEDLVSETDDDDHDGDSVQVEDDDEDSDDVASSIVLNDVDDI